MKKATEELDHILIRGAREHNLKSVEVKIPKRKLVVLTGVSGSGKSSLVVDVLQRALEKEINGKQIKQGCLLYKSDAADE